MDKGSPKNFDSPSLSIKEIPLEFRRQNYHAEKRDISLLFSTENKLNGSTFRTLSLKIELEEFLSIEKLKLLETMRDTA